eukprot:CAMPEP_0181476434 /NCGR_PEP_ID=MMETSP1110-20121109/41703_1 /TAXON_ID=174948 /ORGANISM="Symbiodinium sp., Strain CCMP421" /LENGTH=455 /DNA_ID=CAMNT_0023601713 /DNA_START=55 /DNA_END=1419 /DNA_ORIENTATION=-
MAPFADNMEEWFEAVPELLSSEGWAQAMARPHASLLHRSCPRGGHLIKFHLRGITVSDPPERPGDLLIRPEVRWSLNEKFPINGTSVSPQEFIAPGEAVVQGSTSWNLMRLCTVLFGSMVGDFMSFFYHDAHTQVALRQRVRRNYPTQGDSVCIFWEAEGKPQEGFLMTRPQGDATDCFDVFAVLRMPEDRFAHWATFQFRILLESARKTAQWFLNRPGIKELREVDRKFYTVLSMQSFKRGMPLVPSEHPATVEIDAGERVGFRHWARFEPGDFGSEKFQLAHYVQRFLASAGEELRTFRSLDGSELVPYQCVVVRQEWDRVREKFLTLYPLQKTAYRRANGGSSAPGMHEDVEPKFLPKKSAVPKPEVKQEPRLIVRNTFLDIEEDEEEMVMSRKARRSKTTAVVLVDELGRHSQLLTEEEPCSARPSPLLRADPKFKVSAQAPIGRSVVLPG